MNHMKQVANMLGVEVGEVFRLKEYESYFKFTEKNFESSVNGTTWLAGDSLTLKFILEGNITIKKLPWKPTDEEGYYIPCVDHPQMYDYWTWQDNEADQYRFECGLVFKTREEAIELTKKMLAVVKEKK